MDRLDAYGRPPPSAPGVSRRLLTRAQIDGARPASAQPPPYYARAPAPPPLQPFEPQQPAAGPAPAPTPGAPYPPAPPAAPYVTHGSAAAGAAAAPADLLAMELHACGQVGSGGCLAVELGGGGDGTLTAQLPPAVVVPAGWANVTPNRRGASRCSHSCHPGIAVATAAVLGIIGVLAWCPTDPGSRGRAPCNTGPTLVAVACTVLPFLLLCYVIAAADTALFRMVRSRQGPAAAAAALAALDHAGVRVEVVYACSHIEVTRDSKGHSHRRKVVTLAGAAPLAVVSCTNQPGTEGAAVGGSLLVPGTRGTVVEVLLGVVLEGDGPAQVAALAAALTLAYSRLDQQWEVSWRLVAPDFVQQVTVVRDAGGGAGGAGVGAAAPRIGGDGKPLPPPAQPPHSPTGCCTLFSHAGFWACTLALLAYPWTLAAEGVVARTEVTLVKRLVLAPFSGALPPAGVAPLALTPGVMAGVVAGTLPGFPQPPPPPPQQQQQQQQQWQRQQQYYPAQMAPQYPPQYAPQYPPPALAADEADGVTDPPASPEAAGGYGTARAEGGDPEAAQGGAQAPAWQPQPSATAAVDEAPPPSWPVRYV